MNDQRIPTKHLLMIPREGKLHITWEARHLIVALEGTVRRGILSINGSISRNQGAEKFLKLENMVVDIYLTTSTGNILKQDILHTTNNPPPSKVLHVFQHSYQLPKNTTHIAFGYDLDTGSRHLRHFPIK